MGKLWRRQAAEPMRVRQMGKVDSGPRGKCHQPSAWTAFLHHTHIRDFSQASELKSPPFREPNKSPPAVRGGHWSVARPPTVGKVNATSARQITGNGFRVCALRQCQSSISSVKRMASATVLCTQLDPGWRPYVTASVASVSHESPIGPACHAGMPRDGCVTETRPTAFGRVTTASMCRISLQDLSH